MPADSRREKLFDFVREFAVKDFRIVPVRDSTQQNKALNFSGKFRVIFRTIFRFEIKTFRGSFVLQTGRPSLWFSKPMVCVRVGNHENDEDIPDSHKQGVECWIRGNHGNRENDENHGNPGCKPRVPQTTGLEIPEY